MQSHNQIALHQIFNIIYSTFKRKKLGSLFIYKVLTRSPVFEKQRYDSLITGGHYWKHMFCLT